jgi:hypothetical protein
MVRFVNEELERILKWPRPNEGTIPMPGYTKENYDKPQSG